MFNTIVYAPGGYPGAAELIEKLRAGSTGVTERNPEYFRESEAEFPRESVYLPEDACYDTLAEFYQTNGTAVHRFEKAKTPADGVTSIDLGAEDSVKELVKATFERPAEKRRRREASKRPSPKENNA